MILAVVGGLLLWAFLSAQDKTKTSQLVKAAQMSKWFRVKPGKDGRRFTTNGRVAVKLKHKAKLGPDTNQYVISIAVQCYDARAVGLGTPKVLDDLQAMTQGRLMMTGVFHQNFFDDPQFGGKLTNFPLGPRYGECYPLLVFENCKLEAGKFYAVTVTGTVGISGRERDDTAGIPPKGGRVDWAQVLTYYFLISRIEVSSD